MVHVGVAVLTEQGELMRHRLVNDVERVRQFFAALPQRHKTRRQPPLTALTNVRTL